MRSFYKNICYIFCPNDEMQSPGIQRLASALQGRGNYYVRFRHAPIFVEGDIEPCELVVTASCYHTVIETYKKAGIEVQFYDKGELADIVTGKSKVNTQVKALPLVDTASVPAAEEMNFLATLDTGTIEKARKRTRERVATAEALAALESE